MALIRLALAAVALMLLAACAALDCGADGGNGGYAAACNAEIHF